MPTLVGIKFPSNRLPGGRPKRSAFPIPQVKITTVGILRDVVVPVTGESAKPCVPIKGVTTTRVGNQAKELFLPEVVNPREWRVRALDNILPRGVVKITKFHGSWAGPAWGLISPKLPGNRSRTLRNSAFICNRRDPCVGSATRFFCSSASFATS